MLRSRVVKRPEDGSVKHCIGQTMSHQRYHYRGLIYGEVLTKPLLDFHGTAIFCAPGSPWQAQSGSLKPVVVSKLYCGTQKGSFTP